MPYVLRSLSKNPGFAVIAVLTLALGIGANTAIFSVVNGVLLRPLPYPYADRIVQIWRVGPDDRSGAHSAPDYLEFQRTNSTLATLAAYREEPLTIAPVGREPVRITGAQITVEFFDVFSTPAAMGRTFSSAAGDTRGEPLAIVAYSIWRDMLGSDPAIVGRQVRINSMPHTIVGVMPERFDYPLGARAWVVSSKAVPLPPMDIDGDILETRDVSYFKAIGLLKAGVTADEAQADIGRIADDLAKRFPRTNAARGARVEPLHDEIVGDVRRGLLILLGAVALVLLIACANVASLLLAKASGRQRELAVRAALGATRGRLIAHLLAESLILAAAGGAIGLLVGMWAVELLVAVMPAGVPRAEAIGFDVRVAAVCLLVSLASAVLFGLVPSLQASRADASSVLREGGDRTATGGRGRARARATLVVGEIALTLVLLVTAGLLGNSFMRLLRTDPGFAVDRVAVVEMPLPEAKYKDAKMQAGFYDRLLERLGTRGELDLVALGFPRPFGGGRASGSFFIEGRPAPTRAEQPRAAIATISPDYFRTLGIPLIAGRHLTVKDREPAPASIVVNAVFARRHFPGTNALGKRIRFDDEKDDWLTIVGVVADTRDVGLATDPGPTMYLPYSYFTLPLLSVLATSDGGPAAVASAVRAAVREIDPELPIEQVRPLREIVHSSVAEPRFRTLLLLAFAATALLLAMIGVYGLVSYSVAQRTREIGIRVALGATATQVIRPIVREGMMLALFGVVIGLAAAFLATRLVATFLFGIEATDLVTFSAVAALLLVVALLATYIPSRRALSVDPLTALKVE